MGKIRVECPRCGGTGRLPEHSNVLNGVCFKCDGAGTVESTEAKERAKAKRAARAAERREAQRAEFESRKAAAQDADRIIREYYVGRNDPRLSSLNGIPEQYHSAHFIEWTMKDFPELTRAGYDPVPVARHIKSLKGS